MIRFLSARVNSPRQARRVTMRPAYSQMALLIASAVATFAGMPSSAMAQDVPYTDIAPARDATGGDAPAAPAVPATAEPVSSVQVTSGPECTAQWGIDNTHPVLPVPRTDESALPVAVAAQKLTGRPDRTLRLDGDIDLSRGHTQVKADTATYGIVRNDLEAHGCVRMYRFGDRFTGTDATYNMDASTGYMTEPTYYLAANRAQGTASKVEFQDDENTHIVTGTYTTCAPTKEDWYLKSSTMDLDTGLNEGTARDGVLYFKGVPVLASPWLSFPLNNARQSGVLPPVFGHTSSGGMQFDLPYYFNIAPNRDLTLHPNIIARRGLQLGAEGRYLGDTYAGITTFQFLPDDKSTLDSGLFTQADGSKKHEFTEQRLNRYALQSTHNQTLNQILPGLSFAWNVNLASDDNYPNDFAQNAGTTSVATNRLLNREFDLRYNTDSYTLSAIASRYQVLQDYDANGNPTLVRPYDRMPELNFNGSKLDFHGFDFNLVADYTKFSNSQFDYLGAAQVQGERAYVTPSISYPIVRAGYYITPKVQLDSTAYRLDNLSPGAQTNYQRTVPTTSLDAGLTFERKVSLFGNSMTQTLEPRLFYLRTPYRDQDALPLFDTSLADFNFASIFGDNRFIGHDRIGDANQISVGATSRLLQEDGQERLRLAFAQRFSLTAPRVSINSDPITTSRSDLLLGATGQITQQLAIENELQYSESNSQLVRSNFGVRWQPGPKKVLNLAYRTDKTNEDLRQVDFSTQWPIAKRWYLVGRVNYSLKDRQIAEGLLGMEYRADCWIFRLVGQRIPTSSTMTSSAVFIQLELTGFSKLGTDPIQALSSSIPGYQSTSAP